ncbi:MAG TPA: hypothetical protein VKQ34_03255 [Candidatus Saccharimonadales bacterium]|nr:hypothetical protein [Candidatus Saccharimonadales bacterium]
MNPSASYGPQKKVIATLTVLVVTVVIVLGAKALVRRSAAVSANTPQVTTHTAVSPPATVPSDTPVAPTAPAATPAGTYKDGTYSATGTYDSPGGTENIKVSVTLQNDVITATSAQNRANDPDGREFEDAFIMEYKQFVVGKDISSLQLDNVAGSSLTTQGFNDALDQIKAQAKA